VEGRIPHIIICLPCGYLFGFRRLNGLTLSYWSLSKCELSCEN
jgi:hypothetical protein